MFSSSSQTSQNYLSVSSGASSECTSQQLAVSVPAHTPFSSLSNFSFLDISPSYLICKPFCLTSLNSVDDLRFEPREVYAMG